MTAHLPTFVGIGAMKAGTRTLYEHLRAHPQIAMSTPKELNFFVPEHNWARGLDWYAAHFADDHATAFGEISPVYSRVQRFPGVPERMARTVPDARIVYLLRHPVDRVESHFQHEYAKRNESRPVANAIREEPAYLEVSMYAHQLQAYRSVFPPHRIHVLFTEDLSDPTAGAMRALLEFLDVDPDGAAIESSRRLDRRADRRTTRPALRRMRGNRAAAIAAEAVPPSVRRAASRLTTTRGDADHLRLSPRDRAWLIRRLADDVASLRELVPQAATRWTADWPLSTDR